jgi:hypothetical protein
MTNLVVAPCSHEAARHAVLNWHYSEAMPSGKLVKFGVWEDDKFIGSVLYGRGANNHLLEPYGLEQTEGCELVRVALREHSAPVSQIVAQTIQHLKATQKGLRLIVSFADPAQNHHGGIYQAMNWIYAGHSNPQRSLVIDGEAVHKRTASSLYGTAKPDVIAAKTGKEVYWSEPSYKHVYLYPLDRAMRRKIENLRTAYPKHD